MDEDLNLDTELEEEEKLQTENKNRLKKLSEKVIQEKKEKEELAEAKAKLEEEKAKAEKERDFFKDFSSQSSKYPKATEHQDAIWEKVQKGYSTEDAIVSTLAKEGKLTMETQQESPKVEGGSASNQIGDGGEKTLDKMTTDEKFALLQEAEKKGDISLS